MLPKRNLGLFGVTLASIGSMVGSGWLFGPLYAAQMAGPGAILSWLIGSFFFVFIILVFCELAAMFPIMGGITSYSFFTHGKFTGIVSGWIYFLCFATIVPIEALAVIQYASTYLPILTTVDAAGKHELSIVGYFAAAVTLFIMIFINRFTIKFLTNTNSLATIWKLLIPFGIALVFIMHSNSNFSNLSGSQGFLPYGFEGIMSSLSVGGIIFAFGGFQTGIILAGETKNPQRNIPLATISALIIVTVLYILIQLAFIVAVPESLLTDGWRQLNFSGDLGPFAGLAISLGLTVVGVLLYLDAIISPFGTGLIMTSTTARVMHGLGSMHAAPKFVTKLNKYGSPENSLWLSFAVGLILIFPFPGWKEMAAFLTSSYVMTLAVTPIALVVLREKYPQHKRPFRLPYYKFIALTAFAICGLMMHWIGFTVLIKLTGIILFLIGLYAFLLFKKKRSQLKTLDLKGCIWIIVYLVGFTIINYFSVFGNGIGYFSTFSSNLFAIVFSIIVFFIGCKFSLNKQQIIKNIHEIKD